MEFDPQSIKGNESCIVSETFTSMDSKKELENSLLPNIIDISCGRNTDLRKPLLILKSTAEQNHFLEIVFYCSLLLHLGLKVGSMPMVMAWSLALHIQLFK